MKIAKLFPLKHQKKEEEKALTQLGRDNIAGLNAKMKSLALIKAFWFIICETSIIHLNRDSTITH